MKKRKFRILPRVLAIGAIVGIVSAVPLDTLTNVAARAAVLAVGMSRPDASVRLLENSFSKEPMSADPPIAEQTQVELGPVELTPVPLPYMKDVPIKKDGGGTVLTEQLSVGTSFVHNVAFKNNSGTAVDMNAAVTRQLSIPFKANSENVQVLITHTHTTECYLGYDAGFYNPDDATRTADASRNMIAVGKRVAEKLKEAGIGVIHDTEIHDQPYTGAYSHSRKRVEQYLKEYPSICVVLDIHRDAIYPTATTRVKPTAVIDGKKAAQLMIVIGMQNTKSSPNPHTGDNLAFGARLQQTMHTQYSGLMRPMSLANARYNQQLCKAMVLVEVGSDVNTLEEACYSAELLGNGLIKTLKELST